MATYGNNPYGGGGGATAFPGLDSPEADQIRKYYLEMLGRGEGKPYGVTDEEISSHLKNPGGVEGVKQTIAGSPEGLKYARQVSGQSVPDEWANVPTGFQSAPQPDTKSLPGLTSGLGGRDLRWSGFNMGRAQNPSQSAKDTFLHYGSNATWMPSSKEDAARWFTEFIKPGMEAQGYKVYAVEGDKALVGTRENPNGEWVDFLINAGGTTPELGWQSQMAGGPPAGGGGGTGTGTAGFSTPQLDLGLNDLMGNTTAQQIIALLQDLSKSGYPRDLLLQLLKS